MLLKARSLAQVAKESVGSLPPTASEQAARGCPLPQEPAENFMP